jgi:ribose transport system substrate-binding protein
MKRDSSSAAKVHDAAPRTYTVRAVMRAASILTAFSSMTEILELRTITKRTQQTKATAFRLSETLVEAGLMERVGQQGYRLRVNLAPGRRWRIGYAAQSSVVAFTATVTDSLVAAASEANIDLVVLNNKFSATTALRNADSLIEQKVDLVIDSQIDWAVAAQIAAKFSDAHIPFIAVDIPHPGAFYYGADNYKAGRLAGRYLAKWTAKHWNGEANEIYLVGTDVAGPYLNARLNGMYEGMIEILPGLRSVRCCHLETRGQFEKTLDTVRKYIRIRKLRRVLIGAINDLSALAALQAFRDFGAEEECAVAGQDGCLEARQEMRKDASRLVCSVAYYPERYGKGLIQFATDILSNKSVPPAVLTRHEIVTPQNVDKIYPNDSWMAMAGRSNGQGARAPLN